MTTDTVPPTNPIALIIDDEADICRLISMTLSSMNIKNEVAYNLADAFDKLDNHHYDFCLTDINLPDGSGMEIVRKIGNHIPVAVITAHGDMDMAIEAMQLGAFDFVNKPLSLPRVRTLADNALKVNKAPPQNTSESPKISPEDALLDSRLIGTSEPMSTLRTTIKKLARSQAPVFLWGGSGTGKEVVAKLIHDLSPRKDGSFVPVNCGAIPSELMESEFFGHKKGSFTGATSDKIGLFQQAHGGTLFLDEVADLPLTMQVKLLRAIQEKTVRAIGDTKEVPVDIRILSATHKDLTKLVQAGSFRQDLFYRINVIMVKLPTLNERREDIGLLANHFLSLISKDWQIDKPTLTPDALTKLNRHDFKGNVRELRNLLERAITMTEDNTIDTVHLFGDNSVFGEVPATFDIELDKELSVNAKNTPIATPTTTLTAPSPTRPTPNPNQSSTEIIATEPPPTAPKMGDGRYFDSRGSYPPSQISIAPITNSQKTEPKTDGLSGIKVGTNYSVANHFDKKPNDNDIITLSENVAIDKITLPKEGLEAYLQTQEKMLIMAALAQASNNKTQAAKLLGIPFRSLRYRMKKLELEEDIPNVGDDLSNLVECEDED